MRIRAIVLCLLIATTSNISTISFGSTFKYESLLKGYTKEIVNLKIERNNASLQFTRLKKESENFFAVDTLKLEENYLQALKEVDFNLKPKLEAANRSLLDARTKWIQINKVRLTTGFFGPDLDRINYVLDCIPPYSNGSSSALLVKRYCSNNGNYPKPGDPIPGIPLMSYGGADWQMNDVTTIDVVNANNAYLTAGLKSGFIVPLYPLDFEATRNFLASAQSDIDKFNEEISKVTKAALLARESGNFIARQQHALRTSSADKDFQEISAKIDERMKVLLFGEKAALRAAKQGGDLKSAFSTALQFAYNTKRLNEIASQPLSSFTSLKAFNSIVKITALSERADAIDSSYSNYKASKINGDCGKIFISESEFKILNESAMYLFTKYVGK